MDRTPHPALRATFSRFLCRKSGRRDRSLAAVVCTILVSLCVAPAHAADPKLGRQKALQCQTCHGLDGMSKLPEAPHLAGQVEMYLVKAMGDYKTGARKNEMMNPMAQMLSDEDIAALAAYYSSLEQVK